MDAIVVGAGGHGRVAAAAAAACGHRIVAFTDVCPELLHSTVEGVPVLTDEEVFAQFSAQQIGFINGIGSIGDTSPRRRADETFLAHGWRALTIVHPSAVVSAHVRLEGGVQVMAGAIIQHGTTVSRGCIVNTGAIIDHDCRLEPYCHVAPGAVLSGGVCLGEGCHIGTGATVIQGVVLGTRTIVGAGACVVRGHAGGATLIGVPAHARSVS